MVDKWVGEWEGGKGKGGRRKEEDGGPCPEIEVGRWVVGKVSRYDGRLAVEWVWPTSEGKNLEIQFYFSCDPDSQQILEAAHTR